MAGLNVLKKFCILFLFAILIQQGKFQEHDETGKNESSVFKAIKITC